MQRKVAVPVGSSRAWIRARNALVAVNEPSLR